MPYYLVGVCKNEHLLIVVLCLFITRYTIVVKHAEHEWTVHKRYKHFRQLHDALALFRAKHRIPFPRTGEYAADYYDYFLICILNYS